MVEQFTYAAAALPSHLRWQILDFLRMEWPEGFAGDNRLREWISPAHEHPMHIVLVDGDLLVSHTEVKRKDLEHDGVIYKAYGLSGVLTYPQFRREGYGLQVVEAGKRHIERTDADIAIFNSRLRGFYERAGFIPMESLHMTYGDPAHPTVSDETTFMLFLTEKGRAGRRSFETRPVYFGADTW
ncbi:MAG: GNAT family N-acetyltransferase [Dehalococcoidia bacterium]